MGPIGCLVGVVAQIIHLIIMLIMLPFVLIGSIFGSGRKHG